MKTYTIPALVALLLLPLASPAAAQNKEHMQMEAELRMLQEQNQQLSVAFQQAMEAIKAVNGRFDATMEALRKGFADQALATKNMAGDVGTIAERARDSDTRLRTLSDEIKALQSTLTALASGLAQGGGQSTALPVDPNAAPTAAAPVTPAVAPTAGLTLPDTLGQSPARMLQKAKGDYDAGQYTLAITGFEQLIRSFPDTEAAIEAQYWIGESLLYLNRNTEAVTAFNLALQKGPRSQYAPSALFKRGVAQEKLGDLANARVSYEQAMKQFPTATEATLAQLRLAKLVPPAGSAPARP
jgi:tol-pal system protein YbgF